MNPPGNPNPKKPFIQSCIYADLTRSTKAITTCLAPGTFGMVFPQAHCGPHCETYTPAKGHA